jgi:hypothetical protein
MINVNRGQDLSQYTYIPMFISVRMNINLSVIQHSIDQMTLWQIDLNGIKLCENAFYVFDQGHSMA